MSPHTLSQCQKDGVPFVEGVSALIKNPYENTHYGLFYMSCAGNFPINQIPRRILENEMLCALMCCCHKNPGKGRQKNIYQICVKDILDAANKLQKGRRKIPATRFLAEPIIQLPSVKVGRGRMNPGGPPRQAGTKYVYPDIGILNMIPTLPSNENTIELDNFERFVEMKFPTESANMQNHSTQILGYSAWGKELTTMILTDQSVNTMTIITKNIYTCGCKTDNLQEKENLLSPGPVFSLKKEMELRRSNFEKFLLQTAQHLPQLRMSTTVSVFQRLGSLYNLTALGI